MQKVTVRDRSVAANSMDSRNTGSSQAGPPLKVLTLPYRNRPHVNSYMLDFYDALQVHGIPVYDTLELNDVWLESQATLRDAVIHLQWVHHLWPDCRTSGFYRRLRCGLGLLRFLKTAKRCGARIAITPHNLRRHLHNDWLDSMLLRVVLRSSDVLICHSYSELLSLQRRRAVSCHTLPVVMYHGNYSGRFPQPDNADAIRAKIGVPRGCKLLGAIGSIRSNKGIVELARAFANQAPSAWHLLVAGECSSLSLADAVLQYSQSPGVTFIHGRLSDQELVNLISACDLIALPYIDITGSGALLAAWTLGKPVLATDLPFFIEMSSISRGAVFVYRKDDPTDLRRVLTSLDRSELNASSGRARETAMELRWDRTVFDVVRAFRVVSHRVGPS